MSRRTIPALALLLATLAVFAGCARQEPATLAPDSSRLVNRGVDGNLADGVRVLMRTSVARGISDLARPNGYQRFDATRLPMPAVVDPTARFLRAWGRSRLIDPLLMDINRGMEAATGRYEAVLREQVDDLTIPDVRTLMVGTDTSTTDLLCSDRAALRESFAPVLRQALTDVGYFVTLEKLVREYNAIPLLEDMEAFDVEPELQQRGVDAICLRIAHQESRLRRLEAERPTDDSPDALALRHLLAYPF